jgi:hypothetical protein
VFLNNNGDRNLGEKECDTINWRLSIMSGSFLVLAVGAMTHLMAADVRGIWSATYAGTTDSNGSLSGIVVVLKQDGQGLSGTVATSDETMPVPIEKAGIRRYRDIRNA